MATQETRHPYSSEEGGSEKINPEGIVRGGHYKRYFGTGSKPEDVDKWKEKRNKKGKASYETYKQACERGGLALLVHKSR